MSGIQDLDLYDETRTLVQLGSLARRWRRDNTVEYSWTDLNVALLDNYREQFPYDFV